MPFTSEKLGELKQVAVDAALTVAPHLLEKYGQIEATQKADDMGPVTQLDLWAETEIKKVLGKYDSSYGFLGEEYGAEGSKETYWLIDPIDGTRQFVRGIPFCATMIALVHKNEVLASVIYHFATDEMYTATKGGGAYLGDNRVFMSNRSLELSMVDVSVNLSDKKGVELLCSVGEKTIALCRYNCSAYTNTMTASGKIEGRVWVGRNGGAWDHAPGALLIQEAGGVVKHADGSDYDVNRTDSFIGGTQELVDFALSEVARIGLIKNENS